ncbi:MAG: hypothetical protein Q9170_001370 [Blastenia crenularia]
MIHPFQCLLFCTISSEDERTILLAASKSRIISFSLPDGNLLSSWQCNYSDVPDVHKIDKPSVGPINQSPLPGATKDDLSERETKRRRKSSQDDGSDSSSAEILIEEGKTKRHRSTKPVATDSYVIKLAVTENGNFVLAVTDEDKSIRVLRLHFDGKSMPKRPCAITFTPDQKTILCGDKFGDVYALPLLPDGSTKDGTLQASNDLKAEIGPPRQTKFAISANAKTVHTLKNRKALKHQLNSPHVKPPSKTIGFEHQLLLGHVSLLTDLICVSLSNKDLVHPKDRTYIVTADRDEHIRVSRGMPQAHIIEGFCLGHTQFVSKLCVPSWNPQLLVSGGGDDQLLVWNWLSGRIVHRLDLLKCVSDHINLRYASFDLLGADPMDINTVREEHARIAVSELYALEVKIARGEDRNYILVAVEGVPAIFTFIVAEDGAVKQEEAISTEGNVISLTVSKDQHHVAYAMDTNHKIFSQSRVSAEITQSGRPSIGFLSFSAAEGTWDKDRELQSAIANVLRNLPEDDERAIGGKKSSNRDSVGVLYGLENLRKRG